MRLIDADALIKWLNDTYCDTSKRSWNYNHHVMAMDMIEIIENYPTIEERKRGHWFDPEDDDGRTAWHCSVCDHVVKTIGFYPNYNYCPCCGARMDKGVRK